MAFALMHREYRETVRIGRCRVSWSGGLERDYAPRAQSVSDKPGWNACHMPSPLAPR